jgi:hypothetical protein
LISATEIGSLSEDVSRFPSKTDLNKRGFKHGQKGFFDCGT